MTWIYENYPRPFFLFITGKTLENKQHYGPRGPEFDTLAVK